MWSNKEKIAEQELAAALNVGDALNAAWYANLEQAINSGDRAAQSNIAYKVADWWWMESTQIDVDGQPIWDILYGAPDTRLIDREAVLPDL